MQAKMIAGHELTPGKTVKDHIHVEGTELHVPHVLLCGEQPGTDRAHHGGHPQRGIRRH